MLVRFPDPATFFVMEHPSAALASHHHAHVARHLLGQTAAEPPLSRCTFRAASRKAACNHWTPVLPGACPLKQAMAAHGPQLEPPATCRRAFVPTRQVGRYMRRTKLNASCDGMQDTKQQTRQHKIQDSRPRSLRRATVPNVAWLRQATVPKRFPCKAGQKGSGGQLYRNVAILRATVPKATVAEHCHH